MKMRIYVFTSKIWEYMCLLLKWKVKHESMKIWKYIDTKSEIWKIWKYENVKDLSGCCWRKSPFRLKYTPKVKHEENLHSDENTHQK